MAVNRYDSPAQDRYFNTYVPLPFEQMMPVVAQRQQQLQREQDMLSKTYEDTQNLAYIPGSPDEAYVRNYLGKTGDLVNKYYGQDLSDPIVKQQLRSEFNKMTDKQTLQNIQTSHASWATNQKLKAQLKAEGLYDPALDEDPASAWDTKTLGKTYDYITSPYKNPRPVAEPYFNNIKASDLGASGDYFYSGVTRDKINQVAEAKWGDFANTSEGSLYVKKIAKEQGLDPNNTADRKRIATEYLKGVGEEFIYRNREGATLDAQVRAAQEKKGKSDTEFQNTTQEQSLRVTDNFDPFDIGKMKFDKEGKYVLPYVSGEHMTGIPGFTPGAFSGDIKTGEDKKKLSDEAKVKLDLIRTKLPQLKGLSDRDTYKAYRDLTKDGKAFPDLPLVDLPDVPKPALADYLSDSFLNRSLMVMDDYGSSDLRPSTDESQYSPLRDLGYSTASLKSELKKFAKGDAKATVSVAGLAQSGPQAGMIQLEITDKSKKGGSRGKTRKLYVSSNDQMSAIMSPTNDVYNVIRNMQGGVVGIGEDRDKRSIGIKVVPNVSQNPETKKWDYDYQLEAGYIENGEFIPSVNPETNEKEYVSMAQLRQMQMNRLVNSELINSAMNYTKNTAPSF